MAELSQRRYFNSLLREPIIALASAMNMPKFKNWPANVIGVTALNNKKKVFSLTWSSTQSECFVLFTKGSHIYLFNMHLLRNNSGSICNTECLYHVAVLCLSE